jgi:hypothetical protein
MRGELRRTTLWLVLALAALGGLYYFFVRPFVKKPGSAAAKQA